MKGFILALVIFIILSISTLYCNYYINSVFSEYSDCITIVKTSIRNNDFLIAEKFTKILENKLKEDSRLLYTITERTPIDNAITECGRLLSFIEVKEKSEAYATASGIEIILRNSNKKTVLFGAKNK